MNAEERVRLCDARRRAKEESLAVLEGCCQRMNECSTRCADHAASTRVLQHMQNKKKTRLASLMLQQIRTRRRKNYDLFQTSILEFNLASQIYQISMRQLDALHCMAPKTPIKLPDEIVAKILLLSENMRANAVCRQWRHVMKTSPVLIRFRRSEGYLARSLHY